MKYLFHSLNENIIIFKEKDGVVKGALSISFGVEVTRKRISIYFIKCHDSRENSKKEKLKIGLKVD